MGISSVVQLQEVVERPNSPLMKRRREPKINVTPSEEMVGEGIICRNGARRVVCHHQGQRQR